MTTHYIDHITLTTGHCRLSPRFEVSDATLAIVAPLINKAIATGKHITLPDGLSEFSINATTEGDSLLVTVWAKHGIFSSVLGCSTPEPLVTFGVAYDDEDGIRLWNHMVTTFGTHSSVQHPKRPWCAASLHPSLVFYIDDSSWIGDFERCVAWAWITQNS